MHCVAFSIGLHLPAGQPVHAAEPPSAENRPASQSAHVSSAAATTVLKRPAAHAVHDEAAAALCHLPAGQSVQCKPTASHRHTVLAVQSPVFVFSRYGRLQQCALSTFFASGSAIVRSQVRKTQPASALK